MVLIINQFVIISIHALREEGDPSDFYPYVRLYISIHALREEGDLFQMSINIGGDLFQSTPSARRATGRCWPAYSAR